MNRKIMLLIAAIMPGIYAAKPIEWKTATVISQSVSDQASGTYVAPIGAATVGLPIYHRSNIVVIDIGTHVLTMQEVGNSTLVLPVHDQIRFYADKNWIVILDSKSKKHKFGIVGMEKK